jgi:hypothetical protein
MEQAIDEDYLQRLCDAYVEHFRRPRGRAVCVRRTERFNPRERGDFALLLDALAASRDARELDPGATRAATR